MILSDNIFRVRHKPQLLIFCYNMSTDVVLSAAAAGLTLQEGQAGKTDGLVLAWVTTPAGVFSNRRTENSTVRTTFRRCLGDLRIIECRSDRILEDSMGCIQRAGFYADDQE